MTDISNNRDNNTETITTVAHNNNTSESEIPFDQLYEHTIEQQYQEAQRIQGELDEQEFQRQAEENRRYQHQLQRDEQDRRDLEINFNETNKIDVT